MGNFVFTPTGYTQEGVNVPFLEDARADFAPYYDLRDRTTSELKAEVAAAIGKLGGSAVLFQEGFFGNKPRRYGYVITFQYGNNHARMQAAGLPMRTETAKKKVRVQLQALANVRDWLKAALTSRVFAPGSDVLMQFLLVDGQRTLGQALVEGWKLPASNPALTSGEIIDGVIVE